VCISPGHDRPPPRYGLLSEVRRPMMPLGLRLRQGRAA
jgi:hypothetical protein